jgi:two-component system sensor histidine kinase HydH
LLRETTFLRQPTRFASLIAGAYLAVGWAYVLVSTYLAARWSSSAGELAHIEWAKGIAFILVTAVILYFFTFHLLRRVAQESAAVLRAREALSELERGATAGIILQSIVHDFRNQTQVAWGNMQLLARDMARLPETQRAILGSIEHSVGQLVETLERDHAAGVRSVTRDPTVMDLPEFVAACVDLVRRHPKVAECDVRVTAAEPVVLTGYKPLIHDAMTNLVINAAEALGGAGIIDVRVTTRPGGAAIEVHDNGPGVPEKARERIFKAFYTTKTSGTGLGLLSVKTCAEMHHGRAAVTASPLGGACFRLDLRNAAPAPAFPAPDAATAPAPHVPPAGPPAD